MNTDLDLAGHRPDTRFVALSIQVNTGKKALA